MVHHSSCIRYCASKFCSHLLPIIGLSLFFVCDCCIFDLRQLFIISLNKPAHSLIRQFVVPSVLYGIVMCIRRQSISFGVSDMYCVGDANSLRSFDHLCSMHSTPHHYIAVASFLLHLLVLTRCPYISSVIFAPVCGFLGFVMRSQTRRCLILEGVAFLLLLLM